MTLRTVTNSPSAKRARMAAPSLACRGFGQPALLLRGEHAGEELRCRRWGLHPWRARQADHPRTIAKTRAANIAASSATKGCKEGVASSQRWFQRVERKWVIIRGDVNHGPTGQLAELWRLRPSAGRSIGRPLRCGVFHIGDHGGPWEPTVTVGTSRDARVPVRIDGMTECRTQLWGGIISGLCARFSCVSREFSPWNDLTPGG